MLPDVWQQSGFYKCWKEYLLKLNGYLFCKKNKNLPNLEIILEWSNRQLQRNNTLDFQVAQYWHKQAFF